MQLIDVLCVGTTAYDLTFTVDQHPQPDEKLFASMLVGCGGGPAANAAVTVARLGGTAAFAGYLGQDTFGDLHWDELVADGVRTDWIIRGSHPGPVSTIIAKPDGSRTLIAYRGDTPHLTADSIDFSNIQPKLILLDGHEPHISIPLVAWAKEARIPTLLDAGSLHMGTQALAAQVDYLVGSLKFARQYTGEEDAWLAMHKLQGLAPTVVAVITLGDRGLLWTKNDPLQGQEQTIHHQPPFRVNAIDTTGAGDTFHGALACCLAHNMAWLDALTFASAAAALCCTRLGARHGIPTYAEVVNVIHE